MNTITRGTYANAFTSSLSLEVLRHSTPALFADHAHARTSAKYQFISSEQVLRGLMQAGFVPVEARQGTARKGAQYHGRHLIRLRRQFETVALDDSIPELLFINSHDGRGAYQLQMGLYRVLCSNGLIVSTGSLPAFRMPHRGDAVADVVAAALELCERFVGIAGLVNQMQRLQLAEPQRLRFAESALALRFGTLAQAGLAPSTLLTIWRAQDEGNDVWRTLNVVQENLLRGGLLRRSPGGRLLRMRAINAVRESVRLNCGLWDLATQAVAA
jgi:hypothetical protein